MSSPEEVHGMRRLGLERVTCWAPHLPICRFMVLPQVAQALEESLGDSSFSEPQFPQIINSDLAIPWSGPKNQSSYPTELPG